MINFFHFVNWPFASFFQILKMGFAVEGHVEPGIHELIYFSPYSWYMYIREKSQKNENSPQTP